MSASDHTPLDAPPLSEEARARELARVRNLKIVVIGLGVVLVALALVVFSTLIVRAVKGSGEKQAAASAVSAIRTAVAARARWLSSIPPGSRVIATAIGEGRSRGDASRPIAGSSRSCSTSPPAPKPAASSWRPARSEGTRGRRISRRRVNRMTPLAATARVGYTEPQRRSSGLRPFALRSYSFSGPGRRPLTAKTGVRFPLGAP